jgi:ABC1 atypical kinase-like domain
MRKPSPAPIPQTRLGRIALIGFAAGEFAVGAATEGLKRFARGEAGGLGRALLSASNARRLAARLARLRGAAMKLGQLVSLQGEDVLPPEFAEALAILRAQATPMPRQQLRRMLGREYGKGWERRFLTFDYEPIAAASIGQVHRATTLDGRDLALKIQYPGVARSIASDVDNVAALLRLFNLLTLYLDVEGLATEAKRQLAQEACARTRSHVPARAPALTTARDSLSASQARGFISAVGSHRGARRCTRTCAAAAADAVGALT